MSHSHCHPCAKPEFPTENFAIEEIAEESDFEERDAVCFSLFGTPPAERSETRRGLTPRTASALVLSPVRPQALPQASQIMIQPLPALSVFVEPAQGKALQPFAVPLLDLDEVPSELASTLYKEASDQKAFEFTPMTAVSYGEEKFSGSEGQKCSCKKSQCVRLHCACFKNGGYCGPDCGCTDCVNQSQFESARSFVIKKTLEINPQAFASKIKAVGSSDRLVNSQGCNCSRNGCKKNYCDCFKSGVGCSSLCRCEGCLNGKKELETKEVAEIGKRVSRKKHKIVIGSRVALENEPSFCTRAIVYVPHSKKIRKPNSPAVPKELEI